LKILGFTALTLLGANVFLHRRSGRGFLYPDCLAIVKDENQDYRSCWPAGIADVIEFIMDWSHWRWYHKTRHFLLSFKGKLSYIWQQIYN